MRKKGGFALGAALIVAAFVWLVFDNLALGIIFGLIAGGSVGAAAGAAEARRDATDGR